MQKMIVLGIGQYWFFYWHKEPILTPDYGLVININFLCQ